MKRTGWRWAGIGTVAGWLALAGMAQAADLVITSFTGNGTVQWNYWTPELQSYRIEWAANLATAKWTDLETGLRGLVPTNANMSAEVPMFYRIKAMGAPPTNMVYIPPGTFRMGDTFGEGDADELPVHNVYLSGFYMDRYEVTKAQWDTVANWASTHGYDIAAGGGSGKATNHPVQTVTWYEAVKWCNARSEKELLNPCYSYYVASPPSFVVYRTGTNNALIMGNTGGYRLPTEAEWEKAARGGASGYRFPWVDDTTSHGRANYYSTNSFSYDISLTRGYHPTYTNGGMPYSSPMGAFTANGYGLYDMAGNATEWCWDWYTNTFYSASAIMDPKGPASGTARVLRGGAWGNHAERTRCAKRISRNPDTEDEAIGFRCARGQ